MKKPKKLLVIIALSGTSISALFSSSDQCIAYKAMLKGNICSSPAQLCQQYYKCLRQDPQAAHYYQWRFYDCPEN